MTSSLHAQIRGAQVEVRCADMAATLGFLMDKLGFKVESIYPADSPTTAVVYAHGVRLRLRQAVAGEAVPPFTLHLACDVAALAGGTSLQGPNGLRVELFDAAPAVVVPEGTQEFILTRHTDQWGVGRAGMQYRDLIPGRMNGRFVASNIRIPDGGPVPDYVHYHHVRFQMIFCKAGWVRVVYEDQGPSFVLEAGDCVLQPPGIRHRVLEASPGLEVVEIGCPAVHETCVEHGFDLPTPRLDPARRFGGQRFVRHIAAAAAWRPAGLPGAELADTDIAAATDGLASVRVLRSATGGAPGTAGQHNGDFLFLFVLGGRLSLASAELGHHDLATGDSVVIPAGVPYALQAGPGLALLEVALPPARG